MRRISFSRRILYAPLVLAGAFTLFAVLFPVFARVDRRARGTVLDANGFPLPGVTLRFHDSAGHTLAADTTDDAGQFRQHDLHTLVRNDIDGFVWTTYIPSSGNGGFFTFSPLGTQTFVVVDESGKPVPGVYLVLAPDPQTWRTATVIPALFAVTDNQGIATLQNMPLVARFNIDCDSSRYFVQTIQRHVSNNSVRYDVTVALHQPSTGLPSPT